MIPHFIFLLLFFFMTWTESSFSQKLKTSSQKRSQILEGITLSAEESIHNNAKKTLELKGKVHVTFRDQTLTADYVLIRTDKKTLMASGSVKILTPESEITGDHALLDIETGAGLIDNGALKAGSVSFRGKSLFRTEDQEFITEKGHYTTCKNCPETWSFYSEKIRAQIGSYAYMKNLVLRFGGVPVFWMPYLIVPLKSERQTGLLTPEIEASALGGFTVTQSFFWAPSPSQDFLLSLKHYELRGVKWLLNHRYMLDTQSWGELDFGTIDDRSILQNQSRFHQFHRTSKQDMRRWFLKYDHYYELPDKMIHRAQLNNASDLQYPTDFPLETRNQGDPAMENRTSLTRNSNSFHSSAELGYYINMIDADPKASNLYSVHRLPDLRFSQVSSDLIYTDWKYQWDVTYTHFARNSFSYDNINRAVSNESSPPPRLVETSGPSDQCLSPQWYQNPHCSLTYDGKFDPDRDLIRSGQRLDGLMQFYKTYQTPYFQLTPKMSLRNQNYQFDIENVSGANRFFLRTEVEAKTQISAVFDHRIKHVMEPEITFITIPYLQEDSHPFFGDSARTPYSLNVNVSNQDLNSPWGLQFDYGDRVFDRKVVTAGLTNRWIEKYELEDSSTQYRTLAIWRLSQSYDFYQEKLNLPYRQPLSDLNSELFLNLNQIHLYQRAIYFPYYDLANTSTRFRYNPGDGSYYELGHLRSYNITLGQPVNTSQRIDDLIFQFKKQFSQFSLIARGTYDLNLENNTGGKLKSLGFAGQVKLPGDCWYLTLIHYKVQQGDSISTLNFDFVWDPKQSPSIPESFLNQIGF
jgi:LPS-assembly protein